MNNIDFGKGKIEYNELHIDTSKLLKEQVWELKEDILQVKYCDNNNNVYLLDVGWYPEFNLNGHFKIALIKNFNWSKPKFVKNTNIAEFYNVLNECIYYANNL